MKFVTFQVKTPIGSVLRIGAVGPRGIVDLNAAYGAHLREVFGVYRWRELADAILPPDMLRFIEGGRVSMDAARLALDYAEHARPAGTWPDSETLLYGTEEVKVVAPVPRPVSIRDCSAFMQHSENMARSRGREVPRLFYELPAHYRGSATNVAGPDDPILWPSFSEKLDYELEIAVCVGKYGVNIPEETAEEHIFGYTVFNDVSARDMQGKEMELRFGPTKSKSFENSNIMGPCLATPDELDAHNLRMTARINGELWSEGNTRDMHFKFARLIAYLSKDDPVYPGEFIGSGTVGSGCGMELDRWINPGDVIELEIEGIGTLRNRVKRR